MMAPVLTGGAPFRITPASGSFRVTAA